MCIWPIQRRPVAPSVEGEGFIRVGRFRPIQSEGKNMIANNLIGGASIAFGVLGVLAVANVLTSYVLPEKQTLTGFIESKTGLSTSGGVA